MGEVRVIVAGFGGQGILFLGRLIAYGGMIEDKQVTWFPSYGAEMRGGTANCTAVVSDDMIGSPVIRNPDILIAMNEASLKRFLPGLKPDGLLIYDSSLIKAPEIPPSVTAIAVPATEIAASAGPSGLSPRSVKSANMVMFGALLGATGVVGKESAFRALEQLTPAKRQKGLTENKAAITRGIEYVAHQKSSHN